MKSGSTLLAYDFLISRNLHLDNELDNVPYEIRGVLRVFEASRVTMYFARHAV